MLECFRGSDPLVGVQRQTALQQVNELIEISSLGIIHTARCSNEAGS